MTPTFQQLQRLVSSAPKREGSSSLSLRSFKELVVENLLAGTSFVKGTILQRMAERMPQEEAKQLTSYWLDKFPAATGSSASLIGKEKAEAATPQSQTQTQQVQVQMEAQGQMPENPSFDAINALESSGKGGLMMFHPVLGELLVDLGYKRLYLSSLRALSGAPIWKKQRILRPERSKLIANAKVKSGLSRSISGTISFFVDDSDPQHFGVIDGQHRIGALLILAKEGYWDGEDRNILVEVFSVINDQEITRLFKEINSAEPLHQIDLLTLEEGIDATAAFPGTVANSREIIDAATDEFKARYPVMFKPTAGCRAPHVNVDVLRNDIYMAETLPRRGFTSPEQLIDLLEQLNKQTASRWELYSAEKRSLSQYFKAKKFGFFLGLDSAWKDEL